MKNKLTLHTFQPTFGLAILPVTGSTERVNHHFQIQQFVLVVYQIAFEFQLNPMRYIKCYFQDNPNRTKVHYCYLMLHRHLSREENTFYEATYCSNHRKCILVIYQLLWHISHTYILRNQDKTSISFIFNVVFKFSFTQIRASKVMPDIARGTAYPVTLAHFPFALSTRIRIWFLNHLCS